MVAVQVELPKTSKNRQKHILAGFNCAKCGAPVKDNLVCPRCGAGYLELAPAAGARVRRPWSREQKLNTAALFGVAILLAAAPSLRDVTDMRQLLLVVLFGLMGSVATGWMAKFPSAKRRRRPEPRAQAGGQASACRNCGAILVANQRICNYCETHQFFEFWHTIEYVTHSKKLRQFALYPGMMILSLVIFFYIYAQHQSFSETKLLQLSPIWIFGFLFGYFGYTAERFLPMFYHRQASSVWEAFYRWAQTGNIFSVLYILVPILPIRTPLLFACWGCFVWLIAMRFFFLIVWPGL